MDSILDDVRTILARLLRIDPALIGPTCNVRNLPNVDSLAILESVVAIEDHFGIEIPDEDTEQIKTVKDAIEYIKAHAKA